MINYTRTTLLSFINKKAYKSDFMPTTFENTFKRFEMVPMNRKHFLVYKAILEEYKSKSPKT